jgi:flavin-dependent dehydrogenase
MKNKLMISIIGGGPAGLRTAELLAKEGFNVGVFEQKKKIGAPVQCTGIVTSAINEVLEIPNKIIVNRINKIIVHSENSEMRLNLKSPDIILNREKFDCFLAENAEKNGAKIFLENKFIKKENEKIIIKELKTNKIKEIKTDILVGADGPLSEVYSIINPGIKRIFYKGIQVRAKGKFEKNSFLVYLGKVCPGFFAWVVGENEGVARIGLASMSSQANLLRNFLEKSGIKNKDII